MSMTDETKLFLEYLDLLSKAAKSDNGSFNVQVSQNHYSNTIDIAITGSGIENTWKKELGITESESNQQVDQLADELSNMLQDYLPEIEDELLEEMSHRIAVYSQNYVGVVTTEAIEKYLTEERNRVAAATMKQHEEKLDGFKSRKYKSFENEVRNVYGKETMSAVKRPTTSWEIPQ